MAERAQRTRRIVPSLGRLLMRIIKAQNWDSVAEPGWLTGAPLLGGSVFVTNVDQIAVKSMSLTDMTGDRASRSGGFATM